MEQGSAGDQACMEYLAFTAMSKRSLIFPGFSLTPHNYSQQEETDIQMLLVKEHFLKGREKTVIQQCEIYTWDSRICFAEWLL